MLTLLCDFGGIREHLAFLLSATSFKAVCGLNKKSFPNIVSLSTGDSCAPNLGDVWLLSVFN